MTPRLFPLLALLSAPALLLAPAFAGVIVVDPNGGDGTVLLQNALDTALDGDLVLVRPGIYGPVAQGGVFRTGDRSCTIAADAHGAPIELWGLTVEGLSAGREIVLRGFTVGNAANETSLLVTGCSGLVRFEDCSAVGHVGYFTPAPASVAVAGLAGLEVKVSLNVVLERCTFTGGAGADSNVSDLSGTTPGGPGVCVSDARVAILDGRVTGGSGGTDTLGLNFCNGGDGALVENGVATSHVLAFGGTLRGGGGGNSVNSQPGNGGMGLRCLEDNAAVWTRGVTLLGGEAGTGSLPGSAGEPFVSFAPVTDFPAPWGSVSTMSPLREGETSSLLLTGFPGDAALLLLAPAGDLQPLAARQGALLVSPVGLSGPLLVGTLDAGGSLALSFVVPELPASQDNATLHVQVALLHDGTLTLGGVTHFVWVDAAF